MKIALLEPLALVRAAVRLLFEQRLDGVAVEEFGGSRDLRLALERVADHVLVISYDLPDAWAPAYVRELRRSLPEARIAVLVPRADPMVAGLVLEAGADGVMLKQQGPEAVLEALTAVSRRERYVAPELPLARVELARRALSLSHAGSPEMLSALSRREREVFHLFARGHACARIARALFISPRTVDSHRTSIFKKLGLRSENELVRFALRHRIVELDELELGDGAAALHAGNGG